MSAIQGFQVACVVVAVVASHVAAYQHGKGAGLRLARGIYDRALGGSK